MGSRPLTNPADAAQRAYEDFIPSSEWAQEPKADTLLLYLPGFKKEQLKVQVTSSRSLRISGERQVGENKWSRFHKEVPVSSNYDINEISAKYERGILYVRLPKMIVPEAKPQQEKAEVTKPQGKMQPSPEPPLQPQEPSMQEQPQKPSPDKVIPEDQPQRVAEPLKPAANTGKDEEKKEKTDDGVLANGRGHVIPEKPRKRKENGTDGGVVDDGGKVDTASTRPGRGNRSSVLETAKIIKGKAVAAISSGKEKVRAGNYRQVFGGLAMEPRKLVQLVVAIFCAAVTVLYVMNTIRSLRKSVN